MSLESRMNRARKKLDAAAMEGNSEAITALTAHLQKVLDDDLRLILAGHEIGEVLDMRRDRRITAMGRRLRSTPNADVRSMSDEALLAVIVSGD